MEVGKCFSTPNVWLTGKIAEIVDRPWGAKNRPHVQSAVTTLVELHDGPGVELAKPGADLCPLLQRESLDSRATTSGARSSKSKRQRGSLRSRTGSSPKHSISLTAASAECVEAGAATVSPHQCNLLFCRSIRPCGGGKKDAPGMRSQRRDISARHRAQPEETAGRRAAPEAVLTVNSICLVHASGPAGPGRARRRPPGLVEKPSMH